MVVEQGARLRDEAAADRVETRPYPSAIACAAVARSSTPRESSAGRSVVRSRWKP
jgi:hypothetical protein